LSFHFEEKKPEILRILSFQFEWPPLNFLRKDIFGHFYFSKTVKIFILFSDFPGCGAGFTRATVLDNKNRKTWEYVEGLSRSGLDRMNQDGREGRIWSSEPQNVTIPLTRIGQVGHFAIIFHRFVAICGIH